MPNLVTRSRSLVGPSERPIDGDGWITSAIAWCQWRIHHWGELGRPPRVAGDGGSTPTYISFLLVSSGRREKASGGGAVLCFSVEGVREGLEVETDLDWWTGLRLLVTTTYRPKCPIDRSFLSSSNKKKTPIDPEIASNRSPYDLATAHCCGAALPPDAHAVTPTAGDGFR